MRRLIVVDEEEYQEILRQGLRHKVVLTERDLAGPIDEMTGRFVIAALYEVKEDE